MADTHINAFFGDVEEKLTALLVAQGEYEAAKARLETKKKEVGYIEPGATSEVEDSQTEQSTEEEVKKETKKSSVFGRK